MIDPSQSVFIEYCHNCGQHSWCTKHDEARYYNLFILIKTKIEEEFPELTAYGNTHPAIGKPINPTLGAFEVTFNKHKIFSKLKTRTWPTVKQVLASIRAVLDGQSPTDAELVDYSAIPFGDKSKVNSAGLPSARRTFVSKTYIQIDHPTRSLSRNELETISCHSPGLLKTPRKVAASSLGRVDTATSSRPATSSNYMPKNKISKKKITMVPDTDRPCKMEVYCTIPGVVGPEFAGISVPRGGTFKIPLKFEGKEVRDCWIYLLKDGRPWQKIIMDIYLV